MRLPVYVQRVHQAQVLSLEDQWDFRTLKDLETEGIGELLFNMSRTVHTGEWTSSNNNNIEKNCSENKNTNKTKQNASKVKLIVYGPLIAHVCV